MALAPAFFRDGWPYHVQLYTGHSTGTVTVEGRIYETRNVRNVVASGSIQIPQSKLVIEGYMYIFTHSVCCECTFINMFVCGVGVRKRFNVHKCSSISRH